MSIKLERTYVEKPWGRTELPRMFSPPNDKRIGEVWFAGDPSLPLLVKYIFTSERLSVQVHPNDSEARERGLAQGKSECWYILDADPEARLGLGLTQRISEDELRRAASDGSIEQLMDWRPVVAGDFIFVPPGTIHAIGAGISLLEFQQNSDVTYRLYDYGRPRELHLEDAVAVARPEPFDGSLVQHLAAVEQRMLVDGPHFTLLLADEDALQDRMRWIMPIQGEVQSGETIAGCGECLLAFPGEEVRSSNARILIGATA